MGAKKTEIVQNIFVNLCFFFIFVGNEVFFCRRPQKKHSRPTELSTPFEAMYKTCLRRLDAPKEGQIATATTAMAAVAAATDEHYDCI